MQDQGKENPPQIQTISNSDSALKAAHELSVNIAQNPLVDDSVITPQKVP